MLVKVLLKRDKSLTRARARAVPRNEGGPRHVLQPSILLSVRNMYKSMDLLWAPSLGLYLLPKDPNYGPLFLKVLYNGAIVILQGFRIRGSY